MGACLSFELVAAWGMIVLLIRRRGPIKLRWQANRTPIYGLLRRLIR